MSVIFSVNRANAGEAELIITITDPIGQMLPFEVSLSDHGETVTYIPECSGIHIINVTFGGINVPGKYLSFTHLNYMKSGFLCYLLGKKG